MDEATEARFGEFVAARGTALYRVAYLLTGNHQDAEDLVQLALARLAARWTRLSDPSRAEAYVRRTIYHHQVSRWRLRSWRREAATDVLPETPSSDDPIGQVDLRLRLRSALAQLPRGQRAVVVLRYFEDLPEREVAALLDVSVGTVRSQTYRALARLRVLCPDLAMVKDSKEMTR